MIDDFWHSLWESKKLVPIVFGRTYKLEELPMGLEALEKRETYGKVVVKVRKDDDGDVKSKL